MSSDLEVSSGGWDRTFLDLSSKMSEPICAAWDLVRYRLVTPLDPQKFENCGNEVQEIATRILIGVGALFALFLTCLAPLPILFTVVAWGAMSKIIRAIGFALQTEGFTHVRGEASEKILDVNDPQVKIVTWNICGIAGGMSFDHGGVIHWRSRLEAIVDKIKSEDPDVLILQEIYDTALAEALIAKLKGDYAHFFIHLGPNVWGSMGGCMVISKCAVHHFSNTSFTNNSWMLNRGFATLEIKANPSDSLPCARIIGTHLIHGDEPENRENRMAQVAHIVNSIAQRTLILPTILAGDLNIEREGEEGEALSSSFDHAYQGVEPTYTNRLLVQWECQPQKIWDETIDYISLFKNALPNATLEDCHLIKAFDESYDTKTAISDHHGLSAVLRF